MQSVVLAMINRRYILSIFEINKILFFGCKIINLYKNFFVFQYLGESILIIFFTLLNKDRAFYLLIFYSKDERTNNFHEREAVKLGRLSAGG